MSELVRGAFAALGGCPTRRETALVARALRDSGDREAMRLFEDAAADMRANFPAVVDIALAAGANAHVALELLPEVLCPGWSPFPAGGPKAAEMDATVARLREERGLSATMATDTTTGAS